LAAKVHAAAAEALVEERHVLQVQHRAREEELVDGRKEKVLRLEQNEDRLRQELRTHRRDPRKGGADAALEGVQQQQQLVAIAKRVAFKQGEHLSGHGVGQPTERLVLRRESAERVREEARLRELAQVHPEALQALQRERQHKGGVVHVTR